MATPQYNRIIRKLVVGFGNLFKDISLVRYNPDLTEQQRLLVPISYASKEDYVMRITEDPDLEKKVQITLPRFSFEMMGISYDSTRKLNTNVKNFAQTASGIKSQYNPVPYNFDFNLYLYVRNIEDAAQIIEHIIPFFTPDYTLKMNLIPEMGVIKEIPMVLNSATHNIEYEGPGGRDTRLIVWTLNFTVKGYLYGASSTNSNIITHSITSFYNTIVPSDVVQFTINTSTGAGTYKIGETVYQGYSVSTATATGVVESYNNGYLHLVDVSGNFDSSSLIKGHTSLAEHYYTSHSLLPSKVAKIDIVPNPLTANAGDIWTANTTITEYDNSRPVVPYIPPLPANSTYVICTGMNYGQSRAHRVELVGDMTLIAGSTLSDGTNTRIIEGMETDGVGYTIALITIAPPDRWIDGTGPLTLTLTTP